MADLIAEEILKSRKTVEGAKEGETEKLEQMTMTEVIQGFKVLGNYYAMVNKVDEMDPSEGDSYGSARRRIEAPGSSGTRGRASR